MNFRRLDPDYTSTGKKGLTRGGVGDDLIWREFASDPARCLQVAAAIARNLAVEPDHISPGDSDDDDFLDEAPEGKLLARVHLRRERNRKLVDSKKKSVVKAGGSLACEVCGFNFKAEYGDRGDGFIECHHTKPLETLEPGSKTHVRDLALVCSNCHRVIHRRRPWLTVEEMRTLIQRQTSQGALG
jgi:5-methylcytosine-specific restriction protein A